jgi:hypothetical protein
MKNPAFEGLTLLALLLNASVSLSVEVPGTADPSKGKHERRRE